MPDLADIPNFCCHEHWGSIASIGSTPEGFRVDVAAGTLPTRDTTLTDLVVEPYLGGAMIEKGADVSGGHVGEIGLLDEHRSTLRALRENGVYQATRRGIQFAYGFDIDHDDSAAIAEVSERIAAHYGSLFDWYERLMNKARFSELIRPVHPLYYLRQASDVTAKQEASLMRTVMRIDPFIEMWNVQSPHYRSLAKASCIEPSDAGSFRRLLDWFFDKAVSGRAVGIKQLQAYSRDLSFEKRDDATVRFSGSTTPEQRRIFQDWVVHECCQRADDLGWPHQVHVGTHNLPHSNPTPLGKLANRYDRQKLVLLHGWPFVREVSDLAVRWTNVFIDACWLAVLEPSFFRKAMQCWLREVPSSRITLGNDGTTIEMAVGSSMKVREILGEFLLQRRQAADLLHNNAVALYDYGRPFDAS